MVGAIATGILRQILLVIVGAEAFSCTEITGLSRLGHSTGRLSVDVDVDPSVDQTSVRSEQCPSLTHIGHTAAEIPRPTAASRSITATALPRKHSFDASQQPFAPESMG